MSRQLFILFLGVFISGQLMAIEEPNYKLLEESGNFELRAYQSMIVAETLVPGSMDQASSEGFKRIAGYIFGGNTSGEGRKQKISMTAPVAIEPGSESINMTEPVTLKQQDGNWRVHFVMPKEYTMESLPVPNNSNVTLREIPAKNYAVIRFSGLAGESKVGSKTDALSKWMDEKGIEQKGTPQLARYNPPWTLPFMRRNEVMVAY